ncbi:MAG TPA: metal-binding protein, partial [Ktedonobacter sp.]|nr:metal-binding protein [Ktedonobacter sp.]
IQLDEDIEIIGPIFGHVRMSRISQGLLVNGWVDLTLELTCTRCLTRFEQPLHVPFEERFYPTI